MYVPGRKILQIELAILVRDLEIRVRETAMYAFIHGWTLHFTGMAISSRANDFSIGGGSGRLRFVPFAVLLRDGVNVVRRLIVVHDVQVLADLHAPHVRMVLASLLRRSSPGSMAPGRNILRVRSSRRRLRSRARRHPP